MQKKAKVDVGLWAGLVPENALDHDLLQSMLDNGALGFKSFMSPAGNCVYLLHFMSHLCGPQALLSAGIIAYSSETKQAANVASSCHDAINACSNTEL